MPERTPLVLLHGFGGDALGWAAVQRRLEPECETIAFDLPGHGAALDWPEIGHAGLAAKAVTQSLDALAVPRAHLAGHSMGGAVAVLVALRQPERVASLTLFAPGGFGTRIDAKLLRAFAGASDANEIATLFAHFYGSGHRIPRHLAATIALDRGERRLAALRTVSEAILDGNGQKTLDLGALATTGIPVHVVWGTEDRIVPVTQSEGLPAGFAVSRLPGIGHMPHHEALDDALRALRRSIDTK